MTENRAFWSAFMSGMTAPASLFPSENPYTAYVPRTPVDQHFAAVGLNIAREVRDYDTGSPAQFAEKPPK
jgi:hypothetical protein